MICTLSMGLILLIIVLAIALDGSCAFTSSFSNQQLFTSAGPAISPRIRLSPRYRSSREKYNSHNMNRRERQAADNVDYNDDGWGDDEEVAGSKSASLLERKSDRSRELTMLQEDLAKKRVGQRSLEDSRVVKGVGEEKDFFIPLVTLVSVIGFTGLYGYEMLRLYARGELYLPWDR